VAALYRHHILAGTYQIAQRLIGRLGHVDRCQFSRAGQAGRLDRVAGSSPSRSAIAQSIDSLCTSIPTKALLDLFMACLLISVDTFVFNVWPCVARHVIHDAEEAGRPFASGNHSV
jgi:hypothetical protein